MKGFLSGKNRLVAEIQCRFVVDEGMIHTDTIDREPIEVGLGAEFLSEPPEKVCQTHQYITCGQALHESGISMIGNLPLENRSR
jgi:hypothetical protein